ILQLLLGNIGRPGGGIMALHGHASIQGSTDIPTLFNLLPGYLPMPTSTMETFNDYLGSIASPGHNGCGENAYSYSSSLLIAWRGDAATDDNDLAYNFLPWMTRPHVTYQSVQKLLADEIDSFFITGENPAVGSANCRMQRLNMSHLKWLVVRDFSHTESATWWTDGQEIESGKLHTEKVRTEVLFMPAANDVETSGT